MFLGVGSGRHAEQTAKFSLLSSRCFASASPIGMGTNRLVDPHGDQIIAAAEAALTGVGKTGSVPPLWDGRAAERIVRFQGRGVDDSVRSKAHLLATISPMRHVLS